MTKLMHNNYINENEMTFFCNTALFGKIIFIFILSCFMLFGGMECLWTYFMGGVINIILMCCALVSWMDR